MLNLHDQLRNSAVGGGGEQGDAHQQLPPALGSCFWPG